MAHQHEFFRARADEARAEAGAAKLDNVRERALRAAAAWEVMADRELRLQAERQRRDAEKAHNAEVASLAADDADDNSGEVTVDDADAGASYPLTAVEIQEDADEVGRATAAA